MEIIRNGMEMYDMQIKEGFKDLLKRCVAKNVLTEGNAFNVWREYNDLR